MYVKNAGFMKEIRAQKFIHISDKNRLFKLQRNSGWTKFNYIGMQYVGNLENKELLVKKVS